MIRVSGVYYDGKVSVPRQANLDFTDVGSVRIEGDGLSREYALADVRIGSRVGNSARSIYFSDGAKCESFDNDAIDEALALADEGGLAALLHRLESRWHYVLPALLAVVLSAWATIEFGVPAAARWAAFRMPDGVAIRLGESGLASLDEMVFEPSGLPEVHRNRLDRRFHAMIADLPSGQTYRLQFRRGGAVGANAFALPGGLIVATDELVSLAEQDEEVMAVLAHEAGHVAQRHALRTLFQDSLAALILAGLLGDVTSISTLSATLPTILIQARYSREFEREADRYGVVLLQADGIAADRFAAILRKLERSRPAGDGFDYLSSHPATSDRIEAIEWRP